MKSQDLPVFLVIGLSLLAFANLGTASGGNNQSCFAVGDGCNPSPPPPPTGGGPPPPPVSPPPPGTVNCGLMPNCDFKYGTTSWRVFAGILTESNGIGKLTPNSGTISHFGQGFEPVHPGDDLTIKMRVRAGPQQSSNQNSGCGLGLDFREYKTGNSALIGTYNGPATTDHNWAIITAHFKIPTRNQPDAPVSASTYIIVDEATGQSLPSTTLKGARWGRSNNNDNGLPDPRGNSPLYYQSHDYPYNMNMVEWNHDWFNTMQYCEYDWVTLTTSTGTFSIAPPNAQTSLT